MIDSYKTIEVVNDELIKSYKAKILSNGDIITSFKTALFVETEPPVPVLESGVYKNGELVKTWQEILDYLNGIYAPENMPIKDGAVYGNAFSLFDCDTIVIDDSIHTIGGSAFGRSDNLIAIYFPDSITTFLTDAFHNVSTTVEKINFNDIKTLCECNIEVDAYLWTSSRKLYIANNLITNLVLPNNIENIPNYCFKNCTQLTSLRTNEGLLTIGKSAFENCSNISEIHISSTVTSLGDLCFAYTTGAMNISEAYFEMDNITMPTAGFQAGAFRVKTARAMTIHCKPTNTGIINYNWAGDNITATIIQDL